MTITFGAERIVDIWEEVYPLAKTHWEGTKRYTRHEPFNPSKVRYQQYNDMGCFHAIIARDGKELVGYFGVYIMESMHSQLKMATEDTFFIQPKYRMGRIAWRFLRYIEQYCHEQGVHEIIFSCEQDNTTGIHGLLKLLDYEPVITQYRKILTLTIGADSPATVADESPYATSRPA